MPELILEVPTGVPYKKVTMSSDTPADKKPKWTISRGKPYEIRLPLTGVGSPLGFSIKPVFVPSERNTGMDDRTLGLVCKGCHLISVGEERTVFWPINE
jgi:hypothetical protein